MKKAPGGSPTTYGACGLGAFLSNLDPGEEETYKGLFGSIYKYVQTRY
jgi:hypothetical protein